MNGLQQIEVRLNQLIGLDAAALGASAVSAAVQARMKKRGIQQAEDYAGLLETSGTELQELIENVIVSETWFFRDQQPFRALAQWATTQWLPAHPHGVMRLLSAPCATGEEPFSMVMALLDTGVPSENFVVEAVDISLAALVRTQRAVYGRNSFRSEDLAFRHRYFQPVAGGWLLEPMVRQQVQFRQANLLDPLFAESAGIKDVIFCRNLLIYFDESAQRRLMSALDRLLAPDGILFVGHAEAFAFRSFGFIPADLPGAFAMRKRGTEKITVVEAKRRRSAPPCGSPPIHRGTGGRLIAAGQSTSRRIHLAPAKPTPPAVAGCLVTDPAGELAEARRLADAGELAEAGAKCEAYLQAHGQTSQVFYLLGLVHDAAGKVDCAWDYYRKAVYLEPDYYEALAQLSLLAKKSGDDATARQWHLRARRAHEKLAIKTRTPGREEPTYGNGV